VENKPVPEVKKEPEAIEKKLTSNPTQTVNGVIEHSGKISVDVQGQTQNITVGVVNTLINDASNVTNKEVSNLVPVEGVKK
jgi:hypothetical protein